MSLPLIANSYHASNAIYGNGVVTLNLKSEMYLGANTTGAQLSSIPKTFGYGTYSFRLQSASSPQASFTGSINSGTFFVSFRISGITFQAFFRLPGIADFTFSTPLDFDPAKSFHTYAIDYTATAIRWRADGKDIIPTVGKFSATNFSIFVHLDASDTFIFNPNTSYAYLDSVIACPTNCTNCNHKCSKNSRFRR